MYFYEVTMTLDLPVLGKCTLTVNYYPDKDDIAFARCVARGVPVNVYELDEDTLLDVADEAARVASERIARNEGVRFVHEAYETCT